MEYPIVVGPLNEEDGGGYVAFAPDLPGCMGDGSTAVEALTDAESAIVEWLNTAKRRGMAIPRPGSAAKREREEKEKILEKLRTVAHDFDHIHGRVSNLERVVADMEDRLDHMEEWQRFVTLAHIPVLVPKRKIQSIAIRRIT